jgi:CBS domain containing-hemolysin-like protein
MSVWVKLITPLRWIIRLIADRLTTLIVGKTKTPDNILQVDEFRTVIDEAARAGGLSTTERALVYNLLEAGAVPVPEIMTPRTKIKFVAASINLLGLVLLESNRFP